jgi:glyoxylase-like metal-dependent hydrolase (beta-lactamase superfamily II)
VRVGDLELFLLSDGQVHVDAGGPFGLVPRDLYQRYLPPDEENRVPMSLHCLLVRSRGLTILVDTGMGGKLGPKVEAQWRLTRPRGGLLSELERVGVSPEEVDVVINTHLHGDHCGGNTRSPDGSEPTFPHAEYWVQRIEWAQASHPDARTRNTYVPRNFEPLMRSGRLRLLHGDTPLTDQVHCRITPGHTRGHQSVSLRSGGWQALFVADMASYAAHFGHEAWVTAYDVDPLRNIETKGRWREWAAETGAWLIFQHDPQVPVARMVRAGAKLEVESVEHPQDLTATFPTPQPPPQ